VEFFINNINYFGVTHKDTPLSQREVFYLTEDDVMFAYGLSSSYDIPELFILSTCGRTEIYSYSNSTQLFAFIRALYTRLNRKCNTNYLIHHSGINCVRHMMEVSCSVTSLLVGETQITNQIKNSYKIAKECSTLKSILSRLIHSSLEAGKKIRNKTKLSDGSSSASYASVEKICSLVKDISKENILIIGAGMTGKLVAFNFKKKKANNLFISNRHSKRGKDLSEKVGGNFVPLNEVSKSINKFSIILTCTNATYSLIKFEDMSTLSLSKPIILMDLSVPRNIDNTISTINNVTLLTIDDIDDVICSFRKKRESELPKAIILINEFVLDFTQWFEDLSVTPTIAKLKNHYNKIQTNELEKISNKFDDKTLNAIDIFSNSLLNKIMKDSITFLKSDDISDKSKIQFVNILSSIHKFNK
tara:strand:- start:718 stop:1968 length:1251 start_codon:yes stop_codon:yes gene_type:complete